MYTGWAVVSYTWGVGFSSYSGLGLPPQHRSRWRCSEKHLVLLSLTEGPCWDSSQPHWTQPEPVLRLNRGPEQMLWYWGKGGAGGPSDRILQPPKAELRSPAGCVVPSYCPSQGHLRDSFGLELTLLLSATWVSWRMWSGVSHSGRNVPVWPPGCWVASWSSLHGSRALAGANSQSLQGEKSWSLEPAEVCLTLHKWSSGTQSTKQGQ